MPDIAEDRRVAFALAEAGEPGEAAAILDALVARHPGLGALQADRAALALIAGDPGSARAALIAAADAGFRGLAALLAEPLFAPLAGDPALAARAADPPPAPPAPVPAPVTMTVTGGRAPVSGANTAWNPVEERLEPRFAFPEAPAGPVLPRQRPATAAYDLLAEHVRRGRAAGNHGDLYDNRDRGHSRLEPAAHPQLAEVVYSAAARAADVDYGLADRLLFPAVTFGNSSTAITGGADWRSLPRLALTRPDGTGPMRLWQNAAANQLFVYPAHRDYDEERGDLFPANTPYLLVSRGSSGSDKPLLEAVAMILAALRPDTKARRRRGRADRAAGADGVPPQPADRALARGLLQRRRASGGLRGPHHQPRPHGQPRQLDRDGRHPAAGARSGCSRRCPGPRASTSSATASPSSCSTPPRRSPGSGARAPSGAACSSPPPTPRIRTAGRSTSTGGCCRATPSG